MKATSIKPTDVDDQSSDDFTQMKTDGWHAKMCVPFPPPISQHCVPSLMFCQPLYHRLILLNITTNLSLGLLDLLFLQHAQ